MALLPVSKCRKLCCVAARSWAKVAYNLRIDRVRKVAIERLWNDLEWLACDEQIADSSGDAESTMLLARKGNGKEAKLSLNGNLLTENRNGLIVNTEVLQATGTAERNAALLMLEQIQGADRVTVGADKA